LEKLAQIGGGAVQRHGVEAAKAGLGAMDALHLAAAYLAGADELITTEKPAKAIHRSSLVRVVYLFA
jgi:hypothetical protein